MLNIESMDAFRRARLDQGGLWSIPFTHLLSLDGVVADNLHLIINSTISHDTIYAIRSLASEKEDERLYVDYNESVEDMIIRYAKVLVTGKDGRLLIEDIRRHNRMDIPSWIPNWLDPTSLLGTSLEADYHLYSSNTRWPRRTPGSWEEGNFSLDVKNGNRLMVQAVVLDTVEWMGKSHALLDNDPPSSLEHLNRKTWNKANGWYNLLEELDILMGGPDAAYYLPHRTTALELRWSLLHCLDLEPNIRISELDWDALASQFLPLYLEKTSERWQPSLRTVGATAVGLVPWYQDKYVKSTVHVLARSSDGFECLSNTVERSIVDLLEKQSRPMPKNMYHERISVQLVLILVSMVCFCFGGRQGQREPREPTIEPVLLKNTVEACIRLYALQTTFIDEKPETIASRLSTAGVFTMTHDEFAEKCIPERHATWFSFGRRLGLTKKRFLCQLRKECELGDRLVIISGVSDPQIVRENPDGTFRLIGAAFVPGLLNGEGFEMGVPITTITLA